VTSDVGGADQVMADLATAGVDFADVTLTLENDGVASFAASFHDAFATLEQRRAAVT
jgi:transaldolase